MIERTWGHRGGKSKIERPSIYESHRHPYKNKAISNDLSLPIAPGDSSTHLHAVSRLFSSLRLRFISRTASQKHRDTTFLRIAPSTVDFRLAKYTVDGS